MDGDPVAIAPATALMSSNILTNESVLEGIRASIGLNIDNVNLIFVGYTSNSAYYLNKVCNVHSTKFNIENDLLFFLI